ncbi:MAG: hypothetical protein PWQ29_558 [Verrucomicrobiota bacterium]|jgi:hypothetical protein|nr:hypothetical protein [Verrucomicrobiota bacterium]
MEVILSDPDWYKKPNGPCEAGKGAQRKASNGPKTRYVFSRLIQPIEMEILKWKNYRAKKPSSAIWMA